MRRQLLTADSFGTCLCIGSFVGMVGAGGVGLFLAIVKDTYITRGAYGLGGVLGGTAVGLAMAGFLGVIDLIRIGIGYVASTRRSGERMQPFARRQRTAATTLVRRRSPATTWMGWLVDYLVGSSVQQIPEPLRDRYTEEWADHQTRLNGLRLVWWALCLRGTASRTSQHWHHARPSIGSD